LPQRAQRERGRILFALCPLWLLSEWTKSSY
jgi:hypothetical protein